MAVNKSEGATQVIKIDKTTPQNIKLVASQITGKTFHIQASSEENLSGTAKYQLYIDGSIKKEEIERHDETIIKDKDGGELDE